MNRKRFEAETLDEASLKRLSDLTRLARGDILKMTTLAGSGHPGGSSSKMEQILTLIMSGELAFDPMNERHPGRDRMVCYGMTETCSQIAATPYGERYAPAACGAGRPLDGVNLRVVGGHIEVRGPMRMVGYWGEPPLAPEDWFDTRDMGAVDARSFLHVHARRGDLIVTGGENVYPAEVERELERCPGVDEAAVFGLPDDLWGETVAAALVVDPAHAPRDAEISTWIRTRLAPHKRPRRVCRVGRLPHTAAGKLDRGALAAFAPLLGVLDE